MIRFSGGYKKMGKNETRIGLIALDLDGTLLDSGKRLTERAKNALRAAAERGIHIIPSTGRFYRGIPEEVRDLPFVRYAITINGALVLDGLTGETVYSADISKDTALEVMGFLDTLPVIYDCYMDGWGYMTEAMQQRAEDYIDYAPSLEMVRRLRSPVPELKAFLREQGKGVQKMQLFTRDRALRDGLVERLAARWPELIFTVSLPNNIEINCLDADKGRALLALASRLGIPQEKTVAFGDGTNDLAMLRAAGIGVAMGNAHPDVLAAADRVTADCDHDGVAIAVEELLGLQP